MNNARRRVIFVTPVLMESDTGPAVFARYLWTAFQNHPRIDFHVVAPAEHGRNNLHAVPLGMKPLALYQALYARTITVLGRLDPDVIVHSNVSHALASYRLQCPVLVQVNDYEVANFQLHSLSSWTPTNSRRSLALAWRRRREQRALRAARLALCNSDYVRKTVHERYQLDCKQTRTIYKGVDLSRFSGSATTTRFARGDLDRGPILMFVGSNWHLKGLDILFAAAKLLVGEFPNLRVWVAGSATGHRNATMVELAAQLNLRPHIRFLGRLNPSEIAGRLWLSDIFVLPSRSEALGVAILEALAAGVPVVATAVGGIPEIIRSPDEGRLVRPESPAELANQIAVLLKSNDLRQHIAANGIRRAIDFNKNKMIQAIEEVYLDKYLRRLDD